MNCSARAQQWSLAGGPTGIEHRLGKEAETPLGRVAAKARLPKGCRTPGRMAAADILRLDNHDLGVAGKPRTKARSGNPAADNQDVHFLHHVAGYGLERQAV